MASDTCPQDGSATICRLCRPRRLCRLCRPTPPRTPEHPRAKPQHPSSPAVQNRAPHATSRPPPGFSPSRGRGPIAIGLQALRRRAAVPGSGGDRLDIDSIDRLDRCSPGSRDPAADVEHRGPHRADGVLGQPGPTIPRRRYARGRGRLVVAVRPLHLPRLLADLVVRRPVHRDIPCAPGGGLLPVLLRDRLHRRPPLRRRARRPHAPAGL